MFSTQLKEKTKVRFDTLLIKVGEAKATEILNKLAEMEKTASEDEIFAVKWLYVNSPFSDSASYDFSLFRAYAEHGIFLRNNSPFAKDISEEMFLTYVLQTRMGGEEISDCRKFFYDLLSERIKGLNAYDAIIELNYWLAENVMYRTTDFRTLSAIATYNSAYGRCGEESVFAVNVFRALGIPARQVYTPRWAHCDDNHAWVEVWCEGKWRFLGACEPEEVLDKGWFTNAAGRAMLTFCRSFGELTDEEITSNNGNGTFCVNNLNNYAATKKITVLVKDEKGNPVSDVKVAFGVLNNSHIFPAVTMFTDKSGKVTLTCGLGSLNIRIQKGDIFFERMVYTPDADTFEFVLKHETVKLDVWEDFVSIAPSDGIVKGEKPTEEQKIIGRKKLKAANEKRERRVEAMFDSRRAEEVVSKYGYSRKIYDVLKESRGHFETIMAFLKDENFTPDEKEAALLTLAEKDWRDVDIDVLREALNYSRDYKREKELFYPYIVCPRVWFEKLTLNRKFISEFFSEEQKSDFRSTPKKIWDYVSENIEHDIDSQFQILVIDPVGALTVKKANAVSKKVLFVCICRALGIPARLNPINQLAEYYDDGFVSVETIESGNCTIILEKEDSESWQYLADFGIGVLDGGNYRNLELEDKVWEGNKLTLSVMSGEYRIITDNRLPNGNLFASKYHFRLSPSETKTIKLRKHLADLSQMLYRYTLDDFKVFESDGKEISGSQLTQSRSVLMWLDEGTEPTEHILNEMLEQENEFKKIPANLIFMVRSHDALKNAKLKKVVETFDNIKVYYDSFAPNVEVLARRLFLDPEKLPLIIVTNEPLNAVYACSGYNVGSGEMILRICRFLQNN